MHEEYINRFLDKINIDPDTGCMMWTAYVRNRYGAFRIGSKVKQAHRVAWEMKHGTIPEGMNICHRCDTPTCVNPDHMFIGTQKDNMQDCAQKGRMDHRGEKNSFAILDEDDIRAIRALRGKKTQEEIAKMFGTARGNIANIMTGHSWAHVK